MKKLLRNLLLIAVLISSSYVYSYGQIRIAVSKLSSSYDKWLHKADSNAVLINMYGMRVDSAIMVLSTCQGLLVTGGEDVNPAIYGKQNELSKCEEIDNYRDTLELALIDRALLVRMPVFGICRGEQILNVAMGGTLLTDIPTDVGTQVVHRCPPGSKDCLHGVKIEPESDLRQITGVDKGTVNSFHHQAVDMIAPGMKVTAWSDNGVAEAIERELPLGKSFVMGVQWHPEALKNNPSLSKPLADNFIDQVNTYKQARRHCCGAY